jgi:hypothetical protein
MRAPTGRSLRDPRKDGRYLCINLYAVGSMMPYPDVSIEGYILRDKYSGKLILTHAGYL